MPTNSDMDHAYRANIDLYGHYARAIDARDWPKLSGLFTDDATFGFTQSPASPDADVTYVEGREAVIDMIRSFISVLSASHHLTSSYLVEISDDGDSACSSAYFRAYHAGKDERAHLFQESLGRFDLETVRLGSQWKIRRMLEIMMLDLGTHDAFGIDT